MAVMWGMRVGPDLFRVYKMHGEAAENFPEGVRLRITVDKDRNGKFSALYHVMLGKLVKAINRGPATTSIDDLKKWVKLKRQWFDLVDLPQPTLDGTTHAIEYRSTSFAKMGEEEFHTFAVDSCELILAELAPWVKDAPEWQEVRNILDTILPEAA